MPISVVLPAPLGPSRAENFSLVDLQVDRLQCRQAAGIGFGEVLDPQDGLHG